jgi:hypothetical protein
LKQDEFLRRLSAEQRKRIPLSAVTAVFMELFAEYGDHPNYREPLAELLDALAGEGRIVLPKGKRLWDTVGFPRLPAWVEVVTRPEERAASKPVAWLPELSRLAAQLKQQAQLDDLARINAYLIEHRGKLISVPYRERSLKIFGDEHYMDQKVHKGRMFAGRLPLDVLYAFEAAEPMPYERPPSLLTGKPLLIVENHHSFAGFVKVNAERNAFSAVCFASGNTLASREYSLDAVGETLGTREYFYLGDIDPRGISIPIEVNAARRERGVPLLLPAVNFYTWLLRHGKPLPSKTQQPPVDREKIKEWFSDEHVIQEICALFSKNVRIPQEYLGMEELFHFAVSAV